MNLTTPEAVAFLIGPPLCLILVALFISWRYRLQVQAAMAANSAADFESAGRGRHGAANAPETKRL